MRITLIVLAWFGLLLTALGTTLSFSSSSTFINTGNLGSGVGYFATFCVGTFGTLIALIGGLITKPKYLWIGSVIIGITYLSSYYGYIVPSSSGYLIGFTPQAIAGFLLMLLPGLACIVAGIFLLKFRKRVKNQPS